MRLPGLREIVEVGILGMDYSDRVRVAEIEDAIAELNTANARWVQQKQKKQMQGWFPCPAIDENIDQNNQRIAELQQELASLQ